jgi:hypothetical protein
MKKETKNLKLAMVLRVRIEIEKDVALELHDVSSTLCAWLSRGAYGQNARAHNVNFLISPYVMLVIYLIFCILFFMQRLLASKISV